MLFNSYAFMLGFLPLLMLIIWVLQRLGRTDWLVPVLSIGSFAFYAYWDVRYLPLLIGSILFNYVVGSALVTHPEKSYRKALLLSGLIGNLGLLGYYKYAGFFAANINRAIGTDVPVLQLVLPLGISFFTFTQIEYLVDAYKGEAPRYPLGSYMLFVTFFPHLIAGPILRHHQVIPQFSRSLRDALSDRALATGFLFFAVGLFKKVLIADSIAPWANAAFHPGASLGLVEAWLGALTYTFQLYFDFSGYSDMAVGLALMLNIQIPFNFDSPYKAVSIGDFWRRWHISLSNFLRDYLYIPLGGSRKGRARTVVNLLITMLLGGLWHGAGWTFVIWGGWHGALLSVDHALRWLGVKVSTIVSRPLTFVAVVIGWVAFRATSLSHALSYLASMAGLHGVTSGLQLEIGLSTHAAVLTGLLAFTWLLPNTQELAERMTPKFRWAVFAVACWLAAFLFTGRVTEFLYYQF